MKMKIIVPAAVLLVFSGALHAAGEAANKEGFSGMIGGAVRRLPAVIGSSEYKTEIIPLVSIEYTFKFMTLFAGTIDGAGAALNEKNTGLFVRNSIDLGDPRTKSDIEQGGYDENTPEISSPFSLNFSVGVIFQNNEISLKLKYLPISAEREDSYKKSYHGIICGPHIKSTWLFFERLMLQNELSLSLMDDNFAQGYFGTSSASGKSSAFTPDAGLYQMYAEQMLLYFFLPGTAGGLSVKEALLLGNAAKSPLCQSPFQVETKILLIYNF